MRVIVIGAGIGGLALAQALRRAGIEVSVHDRDPAAEATGGYRLHLDERACAALQRHLAPAHYQALLGSSADASRFGEFTFADQRLRPLLVEATDPTSETLLVGRVPLRRLLAHGLDEAVRWGSTCTGYEADADGVTATFADGGTDRGDLLVAADGARSRVVEQLAGRRMSAPVGTSALTGRTPLTPRVRALLPDLLHRSMVLAFSPEGTAVFLTVHEPDRSPVDPQTCTEIAACTEDPYLIWGPLVPDERFPADVRDREGEALMALAHDLLEGWADPLHALVDAAEPASVAYYPLFTADPGTDLTPWPAGRVTALGDAVHAMPPTAGQAAATAIRDADLLARELAAADPATVPLAVHRYQRGMVGYGAQAVRESLAPLRGQERAQRLLGRRGLSVALPVAAAGARLRSVAGGRRGRGDV